MATADGATNDGNVGGAAIHDATDPANGVYGGNAGDSVDSTSTGGPADPNAPANPLDAVKRGRGRPRKDGSTGGANSSGPRGESEGAKTGRPAGAKLDLGVFATQIYGAHVMFAMVTKCPEFVISEDAAKKLAISLQAVMAQYKITINPKAMAFAQLLATAAAIYGPIMIKIAVRKKNEKAAKEQGTFNVDGSPVMQ